MRDTKGFNGIEYSGDMHEDEGITTTKILLDKVGADFFIAQLEYSCI